MDHKAAVALHQVTESYTIDFREGQRSHQEKISVIKQADFSVFRGECVVLLGDNGAGKSTLLKLIAGILKPDKGSVEVFGKVTCLLDLGAEFDPNLTGKENVLLLGKLHGIADEHIEETLAQVIEFAGIGKFINAPLRCYSAGMYVRLAFSMAIHAQPDILLVDDCLAVGDESFQKKCIEKIFQLKKEGKTIIFVTHDPHRAFLLAQRGIFLKDGAVFFDGPVERAFVYYSQMVGDIGGIAVLDKNKLSVVFNNGKLYLNWDNIPLTKGFGGFAHMRWDTGQLFSKDMIWQVTEKKQDLLIAQGTDPRRRFTQQWKIGVTEDGDVRWDIDILSCSDASLRIVQLNCMLQERFARWSTLTLEGDFSVQTNTNSEWQVVEPLRGYDESLGIVCVHGAGPKGESMPSIAWEAVHCTGVCIPRALITGVEQASRVIALESGQTGASASVSTTLHFFDEKRPCDDWLSYRKVEFTEGHTIGAGVTKIFAERNRVRVFYREVELTSAQCFFTVFYAKGKWFHSSESKQELVKENARTFKISLRWPELNLKQHWRIQLVNEHEISWSVIWESQEESEVASFRSGVFLSDMYSRWFCTHEDGVFPEEFSWKDVSFENADRMTVGVKNAGKLPGVIFDVSQDPGKSLPMMQNSDEAFRSRVLYALMLPPRGKKSISLTGGMVCFSCRLTLLPAEEAVRQYLEAYRKEKLNKELSAQSDALSAQTISAGPLKVIADHAGLRIFYNELEITEGPGVRTIFDVFSIEKQLDSNNARWQVTKVSDAMLVCTLRWDHCPKLFQRWEVLVDNEAVGLIIAASSYENLLIYNEHTGLVVSKNYRQWKMANNEQGDISYDFPGRMRGVALRDNKSREFMVNEEALQGTVFPQMKFVSKSLDVPEITVVSLDKQSGLGMYFLKVDQQYSLQRTPGEYLYFKGEIRVGKSAVLAQPLARQGAVSAGQASAALRFEFDNGRGKIFWENKELTRGLGLYTSFCSRGQWIDSSQAFWQARMLDPGVIEARGIWPWIPVRQVWRISVLKNTIALELENHIYRRHSINVAELNLFLPPQYRQWVVAGKQGVFYDEFSKGDLLRCRPWISRTTQRKGVGVQRVWGRLPRILLVSLAEVPDTYQAISNGDILEVQGRLVQYMKLCQDPETVLEPQEYQFFKGLIKLE